MAAVRDFDGDGDLDLLGTQGVGSKDNHSFAWARNSGSGAFTVLTNIATGGSGDFLQGVAVARFTSGGPLEVALSWHNGGGGIHKLRRPSSPSSGTWTFTTISTTTQREQLSAGDIDRDGDKDLLLGTRWLRKDGSSWTPFTLFSTSSAPDRNRLADVNRDGRLDAVVGYEAISVPGKLAWYGQPFTATRAWTEHVISSNVIGPDEPRRGGHGCGRRSRRDRWRTQSREPSERQAFHIREHQMVAEPVGPATPSTRETSITTALRSPIWTATATSTSCQSGGVTAGCYCMRTAPDDAALSKVPLA